MAVMKVEYHWLDMNSAADSLCGGDISDPSPDGERCPECEAIRGLGQELELITLAMVPNCESVVAALLRFLRERDQ